MRWIVGVNSTSTQTAAHLVALMRQSMQPSLAKGYRLYVSGAYVKYALDTEAVVRTQIFSTTAAILLSVLIIGMAFRHGWYVWVSILPNAIPVVALVGAMKAFDIGLSIGTAMIASVVIGLSVDATIHLLASFREHLHQGMDRQATVVAAIHRPGPAICLSTLLLMMGFCSGYIGHFSPTIYFSGLTALALGVAFFCDMVVLPACIMLMPGMKMNQTSRWSELCVQKVVVE